MKQRSIFITICFTALFFFVSCAQRSSFEGVSAQTLSGEAVSKPQISGSYKVSRNRVYVSTPSVDVNVKRDNVPDVDFPAPEISVPSVNSVSPDFSVLLPEGITFEELFRKAEEDEQPITMGAQEPLSANLIITVSGDSIAEMKKTSSPPAPKTPLTLYYKMSDYTYNSRTLHGACTPMTMINCLNSFNNDGCCTLEETLDLASKLGLWSPKDGMSAEGIFITTAALNELHMTANSAALQGPTDCDELGDIIDRGHTAGVCVDSSMLWKKVPDGYADHMIAILSTDRDANGVLKGFRIIDNGMGKTWISADLYDQCALNCKLGFCMIFGNPDNPPYSPY